MTTRKPRAPKLYIVTTPTGARIVRALSSQGAIKWTVLGSHTARLATAEDVLGMAQATVEDATAEEEEEVFA